MGNTLPVRINQALGVPVISKLASSLSKRSECAAVLACYVLLPDNTIDNYYASLFHVLLITPKAVELFCLLTGDKRYPTYNPPKKASIIACVLSQNYIRSAHLILAESTGAFVIIEAYSLKVEKRIGVSHSLLNSQSNNNYITTMISPAPELLYVGYLSGVVKIWHTAASDPQFSFGNDDEMPAVRSLCYSYKNRRLIVGYEDSHASQDMKLVKPASNLLKTYIPDASSEDSESESLLGFKGACLSIGLIERLNFVAAISSEDRGVYIWSLMTYNLVLKFNMQTIGNPTQIITQLLTVEVNSINYLIFGVSDGSVVISRLDNQDENVVWTPLKQLNLQSGEKNTVEYLAYIRSIDALIVGNSVATVGIISNIFTEVLLEASTRKYETELAESEI